MRSRSVAHLDLAKRAETPEGSGAARSSDPLALRVGLPTLGAMLLAVLAYASPVEMVDADPALGLLAAQAFLDYGTLRLDVYRDEPELAYDLDSDYRLVRRGNSIYPRTLGYSILLAPVVWVANVLGLDMLRQPHEFLLQNLLSALSCGLLFVLLYLACLPLVAPMPALVIATISTFGSPLVSTLATALWNTNLALVFICLALLHIARGKRSWPYLVAVALCAFLSRPSAALFALALAIALLVKTRRAAIACGVALVAGAGLWWLFADTALLSWVPSYYSPRRLLPKYPLSVGLPGVLLSPSRGLLIWCPFLLPLVAAVALSWRALWSRPVGRLALIWPIVMILAVARKGMWWGGHGYGPRLLTEILPAFVLLAALLWRHWSSSNPTPWRTGATAAYLCLAVPAMLIHSYQGLFNREVLRWNDYPDIDHHYQLVFDWRHPQFLASARRIAERQIALEGPGLSTYEPGRRIDFDSPSAVFAGWYRQEEAWRWSHGGQAEIAFVLARPMAGRLGVLELEAGSLGPQTVELFVGDRAVGAVRWNGFEPQRRLLAFDPTHLGAGQHRIRFQISSPRASEGDARLMGVALRSLRLLAVSGDFPGVEYGNATWFVEGFGDEEPGWRWTVEPVARIAYPWGSPEVAGELELSLTGFVTDEQDVRLTLNGRPLGSLRFTGSDVRERTLSLSGAHVRALQLNDLRLEIPGAGSVAGDPRRLGLAVVSLRLRAGSRDQRLPSAGAEATDAVSSR